MRREAATARSQGYLYAGSNTIGDVAWYKVNAYDVESSSPNYGTHPVGKKQANELGLYDMSGNVFEWCLDWYDGSYYSSSPATDPVNTTSASGRVNRGGSWSDNAEYCRVAARSNDTPTYRSSGLGCAWPCSTSSS